MRVKKYFECLKKYSGLEINNEKTFWMPFANSTTEGIWNCVKEIKYLGITLSNSGELIWDSILDKFDKRMDKLKLIWWQSQTLEYRGRLVNSYCIPVLIYPMRCDANIEEVMEHIKKKIRSTLDNKGTRVGYDRLIRSRSQGGYGLIDLCELDGRLKKTWLNYIYENRDDRFINLVKDWNEECRSIAGTGVGPLLSYQEMSGESEVWSYISKELWGIKFYFNYIGDACRWSVNDSATREVCITKVDKNEDLCYTVDEEFMCCDIIPKINNDVELLQKYVYKVKWEKKVIRLELKYKKDWKMVGDNNVRYTKSQVKWKRKHQLDFIMRIKSVCNTGIPEKIKLWARDLYNINLAIRYKTDKCRTCGKLSRSLHFIYKCDNLKIISDELGKRKLLLHKIEIQYINWISHCKMKEIKDVNVANVYAINRIVKMIDRWKMINN